MFVRLAASFILVTTGGFLVQTSMAFSADVEEPQSGPAWSGVYVGIGGGAGAVVFGPSVTDGVDSASANGLGGEGVFGEVTIGYDHMLTERLLIGGLVDAHYGNIGSRGSFTSAGTVLGDATLTNTTGFDALARVGYLMTPQTLGYVLGGYGWQHFEADANIPDIGIPLSFNENRGGYVIGAGLETWIASNWTLKAEYRYSNYGNQTVLSVDDVDISVEPSTHTIHVGANYRLGAQSGGGSSFASPAYQWTGFYIGGAVGAGAIVHEIDVTGGDSAINVNGLGGEGILGELNAGYDHDFGAWVAGIMVDGNYSGVESELNGMDAIGVDGKAKADWGYDVVARMGIKANDTSLAYVLGGYSWQHVKAEITDGVDNLEVAKFGTPGFTIGGGLETAISSRMSVNLEYRYSQYASGQFEVGDDTVLAATPSSQTVRLGTKFKF